ncbi:Acyl-CoA N-acyltransferase [Penicillium malachiteum]|nr:Acyl-CoA N-acyltransferase [Penicillium malachiteum]
MPKKSLFYFPTREISNDRIKLVPFNPAHHGQSFHQHSPAQLFANMSMGPWKTVQDLESAFYDGHDRQILSFDNPESFADGELAGKISYINTSVANLSAELGFVVVLPPYQRSHVAVNAAELMLQNAFDSRDNGGLDLYRVHWKASTSNPASSHLAEKLGFKTVVGVTKWHMRFPKGATKGKVGNGRALPPGSDPDDIWRDTVELSMSWEDWQNGARDKTQTAMTT